MTATNLRGYFLPPSIFYSKLLSVFIKTFLGAVVQSQQQQGFMLGFKTQFLPKYLFEAHKYYEYYVQSRALYKHNKFVDKLLALKS